MAPKGAMTVSEATKKAFNRMPEEFSILDLIRSVRNYTERPSLTDGTITRQLRLLREDKEIDYEIADQQKAIYRKKSNPGDDDDTNGRHQMTIFEIPGV